MNLGAFSVSLSVKDIKASFGFYQKLGFSEVGGNIEQGWLILRNGDHTIGLFQGMFDKNMLTFNPGWDNNAGEVEGYTDVRDIQKRLKESGITPTMEVDENGSGPGHFIIKDPDGNVIMFDQHL